MRGAPLAFRLVIATLVLAGLARTAASSTSATGPARDPFEDDPLCGIQALYNAAALLGVHAAYADVLRPEYIGSQEGSSIAELERAAASLGLSSLAVEGLTVSDLRWSRWPVILHVTPHPSLRDHTHFVLFAGFGDGGTAQIFDGAEDAERWTLAELASRWDGKALVLSRESLAMARLTAPSRYFFIYWTLAGACTVVAFRKLAGGARARAARAARWRACSYDVVVLGAVAGWATLTVHCTSPAGFIAGPDGVRGVLAANASTFLPDVDLSAVREFQRHGATFVDARTPDAYAKGHLPGAVNLPAYTRPISAQRIAAALRRDRPAVVYCANAACPAAHAAAQHLLRAGLRNVVIYSGGWEEWEAQMPAGMTSPGMAHGDGGLPP